MGGGSAVAAGESVIFGLVDGIYEAGLEPQGWPAALESMQEVFGATSSRLFTHDHERNVGRFEYASTRDPARDRAYEECAGRNVWVQGGKGVRTPGTVKTGAEIVPDRDLVKTEFYNEFLRPQNMHHKLLGAIAGEDEAVTYLGFARSEDMAPFGKAELALFKQLMPHLQRALRIQQAIGAEQLMKFAALDAIEALPFGACVLDADGKVLSANQAAEEILAAKDGLALGPEGLVVAHNGARAQLDALIAAAARPTPGNGRESGGELLLPRRESPWPLHLLVTPFTMTRKLLGGARPVALLFLVDRERQHHIDEDRLRQLYRLTAAEARLTALLARGLRLDEAGAELGITYETARTHLKRVFGKTEMMRQPELVRIILSGLAALRA